MTATRSTLAHGASRCAWLLPWGLAALSAACGTSPSMIGESAGAAGATSGTAGASSTDGGSETASGGSTTHHAGAAGNNTSGGASSVGGASVGGASGSGNAAGASKGGASTGGSSNLAGSSSGGASSAGAGGSGSAACMKDADCGAGFNCLYKIADLCSAKGSCFKEPGGVLCMAVAEYCDCSGHPVGVPCYEPFGYSPAPVSKPQSSTTCP